MLLTFATIKTISLLIDLIQTEDDYLFMHEMFARQKINMQDISSLTTNYGSLVMFAPKKRKVF